MVTYATIKGQITIPESDIGVRGLLEAFPQTTGGALTIPGSRVTLGPSSARTDGGGNLPDSGPSALRIPLGTVPAPGDMFWKFVFTPENKKLPAWTVGIYQITGGGGAGIRLDELVEPDVTLVSPELASSVAAHAAAAAASQAAAAASASSASGWAAAALSSAADADASADAADVSEGNAASSASAAAGSASSAAASASTATTQAGIATTKAGEASTSAGTATTKAGEAATSATNAQGYAQQAAGSVSLVAWAPNTVYAAGAVRQAPDGSKIQRPTAGTSRATFDATEKALWTAVLATPGTIEADALISSYAPKTAPVWAGNRQGYFDPALGLYRPSPTALEKARTKAAKALAGLGSLHIACLGDSQTQGGDVTNPWPYVLKRRLADFYGLGGTGIRYPVINWGTGWVWNGSGFTNPNGYGIYENTGAGSSVVGINGTDSIDITAGIDYDYVVLYYMSSGNAPRIQRNGQADAANQWLVPAWPGSTPTAPSFTGLTEEPGYMKGANPSAQGGQVVVKITPSNPQPTDVFKLQSCYDGTTQALFAGIEFRKNDAKGGVRVSNLAQNGKTLQELVVGSPSGSVDNSIGSSGMAVGADMPRSDLTLVALSGTNDWNSGGANVANFKTWLTTLVQRLRATALQGTNTNSTPSNADVVLVVMPEMDYAWYANPANGQNNDNNPTYRSFMSAVYEVADAENVPVIDLAWRWQDHARAQALGIKADWVHPSTLGHTDYAEAIHACLVQMLGGGPSQPAPQPPTFVGATARATGATSLTTTPTAIPLDAEIRDTDGLHSTSTNTERFTIPDGKAGYYMLTGAGMHAAGASYMQFYVNGSAVGPAERMTSGADYQSPVLTTMRYLNDGDYVDFRVAMVSGTSTLLSNSCEVSIARIGV